MKVSLTKAAAREVTAAAEWYEAKREGLGGEFLESVDEGIKRISIAPLSYRVVATDNRRCSLERFPYSLFYKVRNEIVVVACLHGRRDPRLAVERARGVIPFPDPKP